MKPRGWTRFLKWPLTAAVTAAGLYLVFNIYATGNPLWAFAALAILSLGLFVYLSDFAPAYQYLFPGLAGMIVFVAFPLLYTAQIGFTNYSSSNLLRLERAREYLLEQTAPDESRALGYTLHADGNEYRIVLAALDDGTSGIAAPSQKPMYVSPSLALLAPRPAEKTTMQPAAQASFQIDKPLPLIEIIRHRDILMQLKLQLPDGTVLTYAGLREFGPREPLWNSGIDGALVSIATGEQFRSNTETGFFENDKGARIQPGFKVGVGFRNYSRMIFDPDFRGPFLSIFIWTVIFSALTVLFTLVIGLTLAVLLNWESLRFRNLYRTLLFLPYAVPAFISILVFKGLFNQNFGEINAILDALFGVKPAWFADPLLAKAMILLVNTWLGYPYIMVLCSGLIKSIPADLYEASAIAGASPLANLQKITAPLIVKPLTPLLISVFAFNFNNFVLIALLTNGRPDYLNTKLPAGTTDILVSYTYRIAFQDSGQNYGLAAAISTVIFLVVALLSMANLRIARVNQQTP
ncbi:MAG: maltose ABC transporter permease MalF [Betaproteobacteria bacterium]